MKPADLRIKLEGRLEVLERELQLLDALLSLATPRWSSQRAAVLLAIDAYARHAERCAETRVSLLKEDDARGWLDAIAAREARLSQRLETVLAGTAAVRKRGLEARLSTWAELARSFGPVEAGEPLATGEGFTRSPEWALTFLAAATVCAAGQPLLALLLAPLGAVWWDFSKRPVQWRLFRECIEVTAADAPVRRIPFASIEGLDETMLRGLWDVRLGAEPGFLQFALHVRRALAERDKSSSS